MRSPAIARVIRTFETILLDGRFALRSFRRSPTFVVTVAATIALGLGINVALFTLFNTYVLRPIAVRVPEILAPFLPKILTLRIPEILVLLS